jgi:ABC-type lipoprotein export system ATPase subunit
VTGRRFVTTGGQREALATERRLGETWRHAVVNSEVPPPLIQARSITRRYPNGVAALEELSLEVGSCEFISITGPSGCGKSTLLHLLGGLDSPDSGELIIGGLPLHSAGDKELTHFRRHVVGIIFQFFHLLPTMTALENVMLPRLLHGESPRKVRPQASAMIELVGLSDRADHFPHQLSGGQMQRVAIARALVHAPPLLLADEPTGNLDTASATQVLELLGKIAADRRTTLIVVTHSPDVAARARRRIRMQDGRIVAGEL